MPDTFPGEARNIWTGLGIAVAAGLAWLGGRKGEKDKKSTPAPEPQFAGITASLIDSAPVRQMAADVREIRDHLIEQAKLADERREEEEREATFKRLDRVEDNQKTILDAIENLRRGGAQHFPGRPLRDPE